MRPTLGFIGAGRVARTLARAAQAAGWPVVASASRSVTAARALAAEVPGCCACESPQQVADAAGLVFITVPDDSIAAVAQEVRWRKGQSVVHCSGATEVAVLEPATRAGASTGGFHPLQLVADADLALRHMRGCSVAVEAQGGLQSTLETLAADVGYRVITLPPGARALYHAGCFYAAPQLLSLLREACDLWAAFGVAEQDALAALLPLAQGTLATAQQKGLAPALAGPFSRGDAGVVARHVEAIASLSPTRAQLYALLGEHQLRFAQERGVPEETVQRLRAALGRRRSS
ncbi:MAG TPA: DUF2520 domain-containing protein [Ramlibacter sp.]|nr:DUF2520 domain-containing protein [Ramlibacter sp.]